MILCTFQVEELHLASLKEAVDLNNDSDNLFPDETNEKLVDLDSAAKINLKPVDLAFKSNSLNVEEFDEDEDESDEK